MKSAALAVLEDEPGLAAEVEVKPETVVVRAKDVAAAGRHAPRLAEHFGCHTFLIDPVVVDHLSPGHLVVIELTRDIGRLRGARSLSFEGALQSMVAAGIGEHSLIEALAIESAALRQQEKEEAETKGKLDAMPAQRAKILASARSADLEAAAKELSACDSMRELLAMRLEAIRAAGQMKDEEVHALATIAFSGFRDRVERLGRQATKASEILLFSCLELGESDAPDLSLANFTRPSRRAKSLWLEYENTTYSHRLRGLDYGAKVLAFAQYFDRAETTIKAECDRAESAAVALTNNFQDGQ